MNGILFEHTCSGWLSLRRDNQTFGPFLTNQGISTLSDLWEFNSLYNFQIAPLVTSQPTVQLVTSDAVSDVKETAADGQVTSQVSEPRAARCP